MNRHANRNENAKKHRASGLPKNYNELGGTSVVQSIIDNPKQTEVNRTKPNQGKKSDRQ